MTAATTSAVADSAATVNRALQRSRTGWARRSGIASAMPREHHDPGLEQGAHDVGGRGVLGAQRLGAERAARRCARRPTWRRRGRSARARCATPTAGAGPPPRRRRRSGRLPRRRRTSRGPSPHRGGAARSRGARRRQRPTAPRPARPGRRRRCARGLAPVRLVDAVLPVHLVLPVCPVSRVGSCGPWRGPVGEGGFEPPASCSQSRRAAKLRHSPEGVSVPPARWWTVFGALRRGSRTGVHGVGAPTGTLAGL